MRQTALQRDPGQLGGYSGQQVGFGAQIVRTLANIFTSKGWSSAVIFIDPSTAFHHLVREFITGVGDEADYHTVLAALRGAGTPLDAAAQGRILVSLLERKNVDGLLTRLLRDLHQSTWFSLSGVDVTRTLRGTCPRSPLADVAFHLLMGDIADLRAWIASRSEFTALMQTLGLEAQLVIWSDDLAIPWATEQACDLPEALQALMSEVDTQFRRRGFQVNYQKENT